MINQDSDLAKELANEFIKSLRVKFESERKWTLQAIEQLSEEDIGWAASADCNSIANLVAHIRGCVHSRVETILSGIPDARDRDREFEPGLKMTKQEAYEGIRESFDITLAYLKKLERDHSLLLSQPFLHLPPLTYSQIDNEATALNLMTAMFREMHYHTGQIIYVAKLRKGQLVWNYD